MHDSTMLIIILTVVSIGTIVQTVALVGAFLAVRRVEARFHEAERELSQLRPQLEKIGHVVDNLTQLTDSAAEHIPRVAREVENAVDQVRSVARVGAMVFAKPLRPLGAALALWKGLKNGASVYRKLRPAKLPPAQPWTVVP